jgi:hypothetical protein
LAPLNTYYFLLTSELRQDGLRFQPESTTLKGQQLQTTSPIYKHRWHRRQPAGLATRLGANPGAGQDINGFPVGGSS